MNNDKEPKTVGARIKFLREKNKESQEKLGEAIGLSQNSISKLEKGETQLTLENQCSIVKHFNVSHDFLITGKNDNSILSLLVKYVSLSYSTITQGDTTLDCPKLKINKVLFNYLIKTARARHDKYIPDDIKQAWINQEINTFYKSNDKNEFTEFNIFIPVPENLIYPDDNKSDWKQSDLLREINNELLKNSTTNKAR